MHPLLILFAWLVVCSAAIIYYTIFPQVSIIRNLLLSCNFIELLIILLKGHFISLGLGIFKCPNFSVATRFEHVKDVIFRFFRGV